MKSARLLIGSAAILFYGCSSAHMTGSATAVRLSALPQGYWQDIEKSDYLVAFENSSLRIAYGGRVREVMTVLDASQQRARVCRFGRDSVFTWSREDKLLTLHDSALQESHILQPLREKPDALVVASFHLPDSAALGDERIGQIQRELYLRQQKDQRLLRATYHHGASDSNAPPWLRTRSEQDSGALSGQTDLRFAATVTDNTEYIRKLLAEVGWIDAGRFGYSSSNSAFLLVQHSWEPPLMLAVLPQLKQDVDAGRMDAVPYALLFDRLQLSLGGRQRFGSQVATDETGEVFVLPVEDPARVDAWRQSLGLIPLKEYVQVFGASKVKFSQDCQGLSSAASAKSRK